MLVHEIQEAGNHTCVFDAANLPCGIYFYKLAAGGKVLANRTTLIK